jgi:hypothetical protein
MQSRGRARLALPLAVTVLAGGLAIAPPAAHADEGGRWTAQERREDRRDDRRDQRERFERREADRHAAAWRFERGHGWRYEREVGVWSPYYAWWWVGQQVVLMAAPATTVVQYPGGRYVLRGDGVGVPYYWVWVPRQAIVAAPPPPPLGAPAPPDMVLPGPPPPPPAG